MTGSDRYSYYRYLIICPLAIFSINLADCSPSPANTLPIYYSAIFPDTARKEVPTLYLHNDFYRSDSIFSMHSSEGYFPSLLYDLGAQATAPLHFSTKQWLITGGAIGVTALLFTFDGTIDSWARQQKQIHPWIKESSPVISQFGNRYGLALVAAIGSASAILGKEKGVQTSLLATQALITSGVWVRLIKVTTGRERPKGAYIYSHDEEGQWYGPFAEFNHTSSGKKAIFAYDAFPSGHTDVAFAIATVFATQYNDTKLVPVLSYSAASLVGVSRLIEHEHWASDVFVGGLIGYLCGKQVVKHFDESHHNQYNSAYLKHPARTEISFIQKGNQVGISLKWK